MRGLFLLQAHVFSGRIKMMDKEEALHEFIKGLRIAFNNSLAYSREHPYFIKSVEEFRQKINILFGFLNPIKLNITPEALFLDGRYWVKPLPYVELAQILHQRKIKGIEFKPGLDTNELADLLSALALSPKDVFKGGGLGAILKKAETAHIMVEELDYSELLRMQGAGEDGDIWLYLFRGAIASKDVKELAADDSLKRDLANFFHYLKENNKKGLSDCSNALFEYLVRSKDALSQEEAQSLKSLFKGFNESDFADILRTQVSKSDNFDPLSLNLFSMFSQGALSEKTGAFLSGHLNMGEILENDPLSSKRIQVFLSNPDYQSVSPVYRNTLLSLLKDIAYTDDSNFDPKELRLHYRFVLLNILSQKKDREGIKLILTNLNKEWPIISEDKDYGYIRCFLQVISDKEKEGVAFLEDFGSLKDKITVFLEENAWEENSNADLEYLLGLLEKSLKGSQFYLNKIFQEDGINVGGLKLFLKFFPAELNIFYSELESKQHDLGYISRVVKIVAGLGSNLSLAILRHIYSFSNELIKAEILIAMQGLSLFDKEFLLDALRENSRILREEALKALSRESESEKAGLAVLLKAYSPWGSKNNLILENMAIIEELGLKESGSYLIPFTKMNLFWHAPLKKKALNILEGLK